MDIHKCEDCGKRANWHGIKPLLQIKFLASRLEPGNVVPSGECHDCGAFTYMDEVEPLPETIAEQHTRLCQDFRERSANLLGFTDYATMQQRHMEILGPHPIESAGVPLDEEDKWLTADELENF